MSELPAVRPSARAGLERGIGIFDRAARRRADRAALAAGHLDRLPVGPSKLRGSGRPRLVTAE